MTTLHTHTHALRARSRGGVRNAGDLIIQPGNEIETVVMLLFSEWRENDFRMIAATGNRPTNTVYTACKTRYSLIWVSATKSRKIVCVTGSRGRLPRCAPPHRNTLCARFVFNFNRGVRRPRRRRNAILLYAEKSPCPPTQPVVVIAPMK